MICMAKRITVILDDDIVVKLRTLQAKMVKETNSTVSFSKVVNYILKKQLKK